MAVHPNAGKPATQDMLVDVPRLISAYYTQRPEVEDPGQQVAFGTSGHRGSSLKQSFNDMHIAAIAQAIAEYRRAEGVDGPLMIGLDTHALAWPAFVTALEVLVANEVTVIFQEAHKPTPTPVISQAIIEYNHGRDSGLADGVVVTPSHNPPEDGGFKYNPTHGGPADTGATRTIQDRANALMRDDNRAVKRIPFERAIKSPLARPHDFILPYVKALGSVIDLEAIARAGISIGVDPLGGANLPFFEPMAEIHGLDLQVVNDRIDPRFAFMTCDHDGKIRMDCSSGFAMANLIELKDKYDIAFGNDTDGDRHGIVTAEGGLMNPNHYLAASIDYLFTHRPDWGAALGIGKTVVSSSMIDRVAAGLGRPLVEVPVGIKWFQPGLTAGELGFGGEESAGATFLRRNGSVWTTDKDGMIMGLLAAEMLAVTGRDPWARFNDLVDRYGMPYYARRDAAASREQKAVLASLSPEAVQAQTLAGEPIVSRMTRAPGNDAALGGLKVTTENGWFAARPSGTEDIYKIYAESFVGEQHLAQIQSEAEAIVSAALQQAGG
ncbi:MAG: phosphoglucomutase (alpha-D-glucose-1,6-bisphosphate-dependent) [Halothiobacillaceae bacterium]